MSNHQDAHHTIPANSKKVGKAGHSAMELGILRKEMQPQA